MATESRRFTPATAAMLAVLALAVLVRLYGISGRIFEEDELYTLRDSIDFGAAASADGAPGIAGRPLYYVLQHGLLELIPSEPFYLRLPAVLFGVLGVWLTYVLAKWTFGRTAGVVAAALVAVSPWHLAASQTARYWSLLYALAALTLWLVPRAIDSDRPRDYVAAVVAIILGALTHPTFLFPLVGVAAGATLLGRDGGVAARARVGKSVIALWIPVGLVLLVFFVSLKFTGNESAIRNWSGRGVLATVRLVPAMVQWMGPEVFAASIAGLAVLLLTPGDRRWASMACLGGASGLGGLLAASFTTDVYADYGMSMLPLIYVTVGGSVQRLGEMMRPPLRAWFPAMATLVLTAAVLTGTLSHLSDGTRFDYRPSYAWIEENGPEYLVAGWPIILQRHYSPDLRFVELQRTPEFLAGLAEREGNFWLIGSYRRYGLAGGGGGTTDWIRGNCRTVQVHERPRFDYRNYRVELHWCGPGMPPVASDAVGS
jgi:hypothetical protein